MGHRDAAPRDLWTDARLRTITALFYHNTPFGHGIEPSFQPSPKRQFPPHASNALKPACSKCLSPVSDSVKPSSFITTKEMQSVSDQFLSGPALLGSKAALLLLDDLEQSVGGRWLLVRHAENIQRTCINMQRRFKLSQDVGGAGFGRLSGAVAPLPSSPSGGSLTRDSTADG